MFTQSQFQTIYNYHFRISQHLIDCAAKLAEADYRENPGYGHGSIHDLLFHLLSADCIWRVSLATGVEPARLRAADYPDLNSLRHGFEQEHAAWQALLGRLSDEEIQGSMDFTSARRGTVTMQRWHILQHVAFHGMQHYAEIAQLLTVKGQSPGNIDFIYFV
ncbi:MAG: DinB family protein [Chloroflexi bacterium]|nr:DinB family protein [Chloroflexota bacterium]MCL5274497.1 DinB family protein [Chloroflexota bacterium]